MSIIFKSVESINKSPLNNSLSKQMYSFSKGERFKEEINLKKGTEYVYNIPEKTNKRTTSFGIGKRSYDFDVKTIDTPYYNIPSSFSVKKKSKYGSVQLNNRTSSEGCSFYTNISATNKNNNSKPYNNNSFIISSLTKSIMNKTNSSPGPGQYEIIGLRKDGKYPLSKNRTTNSTNFGRSGPKRYDFKDVTNEIPGPGYYKRETIFNMKNGFNFNSRVKTNQCYSFGKKPTKKIQPAKSRDPGPGDYFLPSDFGIYISKNCMNDMRNSYCNSTNFKKKFAIFSGGINSTNSFVLNN